MIIHSIDVINRKALKFLHIWKKWAKQLFLKENSEMISFFESSFHYIYNGWEYFKFTITKKLFRNILLEKQIEFQKDSQLELMNDFVYEQTKLEKITIPWHIKEICKKTFYSINKFSNPRTFEVYGFTFYYDMKNHSFILKIIIFP